MKIVPLLVAVAATASLAACGAEEDPSKPAVGGQTQEAKNRKAMLDFARCMRANGVDMPDPQFNGGRVTQRMKGGNPDKMRAAEKACAKYRKPDQGAGDVRRARRRSSRRPRWPTRAACASTASTSPTRVRRPTAGRGSRSARA